MPVLPCHGCGKLAYTGPVASHELCPHCTVARYREGAVEFHRQPPDLTPTNVCAGSNTATLSDAYKQPGPEKKSRDLLVCRPSNGGVCSKASKQPGPSGSQDRRSGPAGMNVPSGGEGERETKSLPPPGTCLGPARNSMGKVGPDRRRCVASFSKMPVNSQVQHQDPLDQLVYAGSVTCKETQQWGQLTLAFSRKSEK